jgi:hypothetical protein
VRQRLCHAVEERFGTDETVIGQEIGAKGHMLAAAEADFEMERAIVSEQRLRGDFAFFGNGDAGQQCINQSLLAHAQGLALGAAIETVERGRIAGLVRCHGAARWQTRTRGSIKTAAPAF